MAWWSATSRHEAAVGGTIALVEEGGPIAIDAAARLLVKYAKPVSSASKGAVTD